MESCFLFSVPVINLLGRGGGGKLLSLQRAGCYKHLGMGKGWEVAFSLACLLL